ncbi:hypothetical protein [Muricoccus vinaceus]|uniref:Uncharacterized protein n=1 Tax=Muricoccus vinaceus TaxID=424704 RepID=A0ABV6J1I1_9PROT
MSQTEWIRLRRIAAVLTRSKATTVNDLIQETCARVLGDTRPWPVNIPFFAFFAGVMKSVAGEEVQKLRRAREAGSGVRAPLSLHDKVGGLAFDPPDLRPNAEQVLLEQEAATETKAAILALFHDDPAAALMVEGKIDGIEGEELRELVGLEITDFQSKNRLIRRRMLKLNPGRPVS